MISIRPRDPEDLDGCVEVLARVHAADGYPAAWPDDPGRWLMPSRLLGAWVAGRAGALVGHVGLSGASPGPSAEYWSASTGLPPDRLGAVRQLFVAPDARGDGLGERLLSHATAAALRQGLHPVLDVIEKNRTATALYERLGWRVVGAIDVKFGGRPERLVCYVAPCA